MKFNKHSAFKLGGQKNYIFFNHDPGLYGV